MSLLDKASLIITPNAYKESKLYSVIPSNGDGDMTVVRATTPTRVNEAGLIEVVPKNLLTYSEQFDNSIWSKLTSGTGSLPVVTSDYSNSPDGNLTMDRIQLSLNGGTSGSDLSYISRNISTSSATFSFYAKSNTTPCTIYFRTGGTVTTINITNTTQRFTLYSSSAITLVQFGLRGGSYGGALNSDIADISVWGAQLEAGSTATSYFPTTDRLNIPRIDYTGGGCPSILVEPQRTNSITYSNDFSQSIYGKINLTITANQGISPDGTQNANLLVPNAAVGNRYIINSTGSNLKINTVFLKKKELRYVKIGNAQSVVLVDLENGTISAGSVSTNNFTIENYGNGWYRVSCYNTLDVNLQIQVFFGVDGSGSNIATNGTDGVYIYGFEIQNGSYATSYIPTQGSQVTRNADVISKTGISSLIGQTEGSVYIEVNISNTSAKLLIVLDTGSASNFILLDANIGLSPRILVRQSSGSFPAIITGTAMSYGINKIAFCYKSGDYAMYANGVLSGTSASTTFPSGIISKISVGANPSYGYLSDTVNDVKLYNTRLSNAELQALTIL